MQNKPFFSVVIPTRNRAKLITEAIQSVFDQTFGDFELIISNNFSDDNTSEVIKQISDPRIKYVETSSFLSINESWEFALSHATGNYVVFLSDDDAYSNIFLETFEETIRLTEADVMACEIARFYETSRFGSAHKFTCANFTNQIFEYDCRNKRNEILQYMFAKGLVAEYPKNIHFQGTPFLVNSAYKLDIFAKVKNKLNAIFLRNLASTDVYSSVIILSQYTDKYCYVDKPLYIHRSSEVSITNSPDIETKKKTYGMPSHNLGKYHDYFLPFSNTNLWLEACFLAVEDSQTNINFNLSWLQYYLKSYDFLRYLETLGEDISKELAGFYATLSRRDKKFQKDVKDVIDNPRRKFSEFIRKSKTINSFLTKKSLKENLLSWDDKLEINYYAKLIDKNFLDKFHRKK